MTTHPTVRRCPSAPRRQDRAPMWFAALFALLVPAVMALMGSFVSEPPAATSSAASTQADAPSTGGRRRSLLQE